MEKSIKRVEKLVHATNSALAQMKFSLMFDDMSGDGHGEFGGVQLSDPLPGRKFTDGDDLKHCQNEFKSEASEMLEKMETMFGSNELAKRNAKAVDKIKEINKRMNSLRSEQSKLEETEQSRRKLLNLINEEKFSSGFTSSWDSAQSKQGVREKKPSEMPAKRTDSTVSKSKEELKSKILETQDIVNRGFQTARQLAQRVETISRCERKEKTSPSTNKTLSESNLRSSEGKAESNETVSSVKCRKCARRAGRRRRREAGEAEQINARVVEVKREELQRCRRSNLQLQRLPSLHIRGSLQLQKVHNLEIPAGGDASLVKSNTAVNFLSHEQMENEKMGELIEKVRKENCCCTGSNPQGNYVECFNCGKLIRVRETRVDPRKVDEILRKCNFDVFDPRIDEFVEKCGTDWCNKVESPGDAATPLQEDAATGEPKKDDRPKKSSVKLRGLSEKLFRKYQREAEAMESNHLKLENILQNLFRQIDESREVFEKCHLFQSDDGSQPKLTATKPVVVSLTGRPGRGRTKLNKHHVNNTNRVEIVVKNKPDGKSREREKWRGRTLMYANPTGNKRADAKEEMLIVSSSGSEMLQEAGKEVQSPGVSSSTSGSSSRSQYVCGRDAKDTPGPSIRYRSRKPDIREGDTQRKSSSACRFKTGSASAVRENRAEEERPPSESSTSGRKTGQIDDNIVKPSPSPVSKLGEDETRGRAASNKSEEKAETSSDESENNYESDFESMTNENPDECEEGEPETNMAGAKLSTISEVDSELERKLSDEQKTGRNEGSETGATPPKQNHPEVLTESGKPEVASLKSTPTELVTSLKDILSALQDQFVRTESLAEKLTENVKSEGVEKSEARVTLLRDVMLKKPIGTELVENLRSARKGLAGEPKSPRRNARRKKAPEKSGFSVDSLSDEGGSSLGEIIVSDRRRKSSEKSQSSSISECSFLRLESGRKSAIVAPNWREVSAEAAFKLEVESEELLYSEGEIPSDEVLAVERFRTSSLGEVVSEKNSAASTL